MLVSSKKFKLRSFYRGGQDATIAVFEKFAAIGNVNGRSELSCKWETRT